MSQEFLLQLSPCRQDTGVEVAMRTPKSFYAQQRRIYQPELLTCPHCGDLVMLCNYLMLIRYHFDYELARIWLSGVPETSRHDR
jgi:hypothetical protein